MWFSRLDCHPVTERLQVQFQVRAHAEVIVSVPGLGVDAPLSRCIWEAISQCFSFFLPLSLKSNEKMSSGEDVFLKKGNSD